MRLRKLMVNMSLRMHPDVIVGSQINHTLNKVIRNFTNKNVNPPCNSLLATSRAKSEWLVLRVEWPPF